MACSNCGMPCQGSMCRDCERAEYLEDRHGVPGDHIDDEDEEGST